MFERRVLDSEVAAIRDEHAPHAIVLDATADFETLTGASLDDLATRVDAIQPHDYDPAWVPEESPDLLHRLTRTALVVGMPGDGSIVWTTQTTPPVVIVKPRVQGSPADFVDFLVAEALVAAGLDLPEHFLGFFRSEYPAFADAVPDDAHTTYQLAVAVCEAYRGRHLRSVFEAWPTAHPRLGAAWADAGTRLADRLADLPTDVARGDTQFADAAELACAGVKHDIDVPPPFAALDTLAFEDHGARFATRWAEKLFD
jgi:hypothetical protein